jgi:hypothetical protein
MFKINYELILEGEAEDNTKKYFSYFEDRLVLILHMHDL